MTSRPNPRVRADWERTRAQFEREERDAAAARAQRITSSHAARAVHEASQQLPATPVATAYARRLRERYLDHVAKKAVYVTPEDYVRSNGAEVASAFVLPVALYLAYWVLSTTIAAPFSTSVTIIWSATQLAFYFFVWLLVVAAPAQAIGSRISERRLRTVLDDAEAYARWSESVNSSDPDPAP